MNDKQDGQNGGQNNGRFPEGPVHALVSVGKGNSQRDGACHFAAVTVEAPFPAVKRKHVLRSVFRPAVAAQTGFFQNFAFAQNGEKGFPVDLPDFGLVVLLSAPV